MNSIQQLHTLDNAARGPAKTRQHITHFIFFLIATFIGVFVPMILAAGTVAGVMFVLSGGHFRPYLWVIASPVLYFCWLIAYLAVTAWMTAQLGKKNPKPRHAVLTRGARVVESPGLLTALFCYRRIAILNSLPLVSSMQVSGIFRTLAIRAYSPSVHIGTDSVIAGQVLDPDLTEIGDEVMIGAGSIVSAHATTMQPGGSTYMTAPIRIGNRTTIGGTSVVGPGCVLEDDAVLEVGSILQPFTRVPAAEVWGGNPARFLKKRDERWEQRVSEPAPSTEVGDVATELTAQKAAADSAAPPEQAAVADVRALVIEALALKPEETPETLDMEHCEFWDSMGQMSIASMIFDRYGISVPASELPRIKSLLDVMRLIEGHELGQQEMTTDASGLSGARGH